MMKQRFAFKHLRNFRADENSYIDSVSRIFPTANPPENSRRSVQQFGKFDRFGNAAECKTWSREPCHPQFLPSRYPGRIPNKYENLPIENSFSRSIEFPRTHSPSDRRGKNKGKIAMEEMGKRLNTCCETKYHRLFVGKIQIPVRNWQGRTSFPNNRW